MKLIFLLAIVLAISTLTYSKVINQKMGKSSIKKDSWYPMTKFVMGVGKGSYSLKIWNASPKTGSQVVPVSLYLFTYDTWQLQQSESSCEAKAKHSVYNTPMSLPLNGTEVELSSMSLGQDHGTQVWYFALGSCGDSYSNIMLQSNQITYDLTIMNADGSHISEEENGVITVLWIAIIPIFLFFIFNGVKLLSFYSSKSALDFPLVMLVFALVLEFLGLATELVHLYFYASNGQGFFIFDWANAVFANMAQLIISVLFILMATGWTVRSLSPKDEEMFAVMGMIAAIAVIVNTVMAKISTNDIDSYHDYENLTGIVSLLIKLGLFGLFGHQLTQNYEKAEGKLKRHYIKLGVFGSVYLLSFPLAVILADFFLPPYMRHKATTYITIIAQSATLLAYASMLSTKEGEYYPIVYKNRAILPMNKMG